LDPDLLLRAYLHWADRDNIPALIGMVEAPTLPSWSPRKTGLVMQALGKLQDERVLAVMVPKLADPALHDQAVAALQLMGPKAEGPVLDCLFAPDPATRQRASQLLAGYGTSARTVAAAALERLKSKQPDLQLAAAAWFADNPPGDGAPQPEVAKLLADLL